MDLHPSEHPLKVGMTYDTRDDFKFTSPEPEDWDAEFAVSVAVDDIAHALEDLGHEALYIGSGRKLLDSFREYEGKVDIIFNIAEGYFGRAREAQVPAMLEMAGVPYVGSDAYTLALSLNKWHTKVLASHYHIRTPAFALVRNDYEIDLCRPRSYPVICKLCYEGSSKGLKEDSIVHNRTELRSLLRYLLRTYKQPILVEQFVRGREIDVPIIGSSPNKAFGVVGISLDGSLNLGNKFLTSKIVEADSYGFKYPLDEPFVAKADSDAILLYNLLECRDFGRIDMRIDERGVPYFLEINPYPYLGKHSSFNEIATKSGLGYTNMIGMILQSALERQTLRSRV
jgi:D-alanine-D-alanine ligase